MPIHLNSLFSRRRFMQGATALSLSPSLSALSAEKETETWAFLSDTHIDKDPDFISRQGTHLADNLKRVVAEVIAEKDALSGVIINGDCAFNTGLQGDYEVLAGLLKPIIDAGLPLHMTMGNHDDRGPFFSVFDKMKSAKPVIDAKHVGIVETPLANLVFLDSLRFVNKVEGEFGDHQLKWLEDFLKENSAKPAILIGHHYPQIIREDVIPSDKPIKIAGLVDSEPFFDIIEKHANAKAYIYGHSHKWGIKSDKAGFHQINLPPTAYVFDEKQPNGWVRATVSESGMKLELSTLDKKHPAHGEVNQLAWR